MIQPQELPFSPQALMDSMPAFPDFLSERQRNYLTEIHATHRTMRGVHRKKELVRFIGELIRMSPAPLNYENGWFNVMGKNLLPISGTTLMAYKKQLGIVDKVCGTRGCE